MARVYEDMDPAYAATCSDVTLCSNTKGFFRGWSEELMSNVDDDWLTRLENIEDGKKVQAVKDNKEIMEPLNEVLSRIQPLHRGKDPKVSHERWQAAKTAMEAGELNKALTLASQAIFKAPVTGVDEITDGDITLALALWLRSDILLRLGRPRAALEDLKMALKEHLPAKMRAQYYWRMGHCYNGAGEPTRAKVSYELAARLLGADQDAKAKLMKDIDALDYSVQPKHSPDKTGVTLTGGAKQNMPALSRLVKIIEEENKGRFAVANDSIKTGDVLLIDSPYAACLLPDYYGSYCLHCFKRLENCEDTAPVWCPKCSGIVFCSAQCRDTSVSTYHKYECQFLDLFIGSGMSVLSHIALRMITQAGLDTCLSIHSKYLSNKVKTVEGSALNDIEGVAKKSKMKSRKERLNRSKKGLKSFTDKLKQDEVEDKKEDRMNLEEKMELKAAQIYSLCTHTEQRKGEDYLKRIIMSMFLTECLKKAGFFKKCDTNDLAKVEVSICELIIRNLQLLQFNAHEIYETIRGEHMFTGSKPIYIAVGIYPTGALFNHECYPAVARYFEGRNIVLRTTRPLSPGDIVSENYGPHFLLRGLKERQRALACRYWFRCECTACKEDWPTLKELSSNAPPSLRCHNINCSGKFRAIPQCVPARCTKCSTNIDMDLVKINLDSVNRCLNQYQEGAKLMEAEQPEDAIAVMCEAIDTYHEIARPPHKDTHLAQESLRTCFAIHGNVHIVRGGTAQGTEQTHFKKAPTSFLPYTHKRIGLNIGPSSRISALLKNQQEETNQIDILVDKTELDRQLEYRELIEEQYYSNIAIAKCMIEIDESTNSKCLNSHHSGLQPISVKLPEIKLPTFDGSYDQWLEFHPTFNKPSEIDLLIGADLFWDLLDNDRIRLPTGPCLQSSKLDTQLKRFWELEEVSNTNKSLTKDEHTCESVFVTTTKRDSDGRFLVRIPLRESVDHLDASQTAYGACAYIRTYNNNDDSPVTVKLLCAKSKVSPIKPVTIPRLELCGALLGARLYKKIKELSLFLENNYKHIVDYSTNEGIKLKFIPPYSPHFGGLWEAGVKSCKYHLKRVVGNSNFTFEEFSTILTQIESILNSRPMYPLSSDPNDFLPLTPAHFLIGRPLTAPPCRDVTTSLTHRLIRYDRVEQMRQHFWQRWSKEYVSELQTRTKWKMQQQDITLNTLVLIKEENLPPLKWRLGRILRTFPGKDGISRVADILTSNGIIQRATSKICALPSQSSEEI
ncbi:SET and MYND domain containing, class 4, member 2 [Aphomia sociella]